MLRGAMDRCVPASLLALGDGLHLRRPSSCRLVLFRQFVGMLTKKMTPSRVTSFCRFEEESGIERFLFEAGLQAFLRKHFLLHSAER